MKPNFDCKLYLVTDREMLKDIDLCTAVEQAILGGVTLVQLREKNLNSYDLYYAALEIKKVTDKYNVPLIINDRLDIMMAVDAAGVHVGQNDMPAKVARQLIGENKILGVSTATVAEAIEAEEAGADYLGVGAMFVTTTKNDTRSVSVDLLKQIKESVKIPVAVIGGINTGNISLLLPSKIDGVAVVSDILAKDDIRLAAQNIRELF